MSVSCDGEYADVYNESRPRARKAHQCSACRESIPRGHVYVKCSSLYDGSWTVWKRCLRCEAIYRHLAKRCIEYNKSGRLAAAELRRLVAAGQAKAADGAYWHEDRWPASALNCGLTYEDEWGDLPDEIAALAFKTPAEMQEADHG